MPFFIFLIERSCWCSSCPCPSEIVEPFSKRLFQEPTWHFCSAIPAALHFLRTCALCLSLNRPLLRSACRCVHCARIAICINLMKEWRQRTHKPKLIWPVTSTPSLCKFWYMPTPAGRNFKCWIHRSSRGTSSAVSYKVSLLHLPFQRIFFNKSPNFYYNLLYCVTWQHNTSWDNYMYTFFF